jgi:hypothetical protein
VDDEQGPWWTRPPEPDAQQRSDTEAPPPQYPAHQPTAPIPGLEPAPFDPTLVVPGPMVAPEAEPDSPAPTTTSDREPGSDQPEPEPAPPPRPKRPVVRRVAVVPPERPERPARPVPAARPDDRTETLPAVSDDIFATFSGPASTAPYPPADPAPPPGPRRRPRIDLPETRVLLLAGAAGLVAVLIVIVALLTGGSGDDPDRPAAREPAPTSTVGAVKGLKKVEPAAASELLQKAGQSSYGSVVEAWTWKDSNGENLVATTIAAAPRKHRTLRVIHVADLDHDPRTLRVMRDPGLPAGCQAAGSADFTPKSLVVRDLDDDDIAEVSAGWTSRCGGPGSPSVIKLALITNGVKYIIRGEGVVPGADVDAAVPAPRASKWPDGYFKALAAQYRSLYGS